jgi:phytoene synthase
MAIGRVDQEYAPDLAACRRLLKGGSRSFHAASRLLPERIRAPASALYAFCRVADDAIDLAPRHDRHRLDMLNRRLDRIYAGRPDDRPVDRAFARTVAAFGLPRALPDAMLEGFLWDCEERRYRSLVDLAAYGARVAGSVGAMMAVLMDRRAPEVLARATDLGVAMQFTNIARDVGEDARAGRLYLPTDWLEAADINPDAWLANPVSSPALSRIVRQLLVAADELYRRADAGIAALPADCRPAIQAARRLYAGIGDEILRRDINVVTTRAVVPASRKLRLLTVAVTSAMLPGDPVAFTAPPLDGNRFLVDAAQSMSPRRPRRHTGLVRILELFEELERRDRAALAGE